MRTALVDTALGNGGDQAGNRNVETGRSDARRPEQHGDRLGADEPDDIVNPGGAADDGGRSEDGAVGGASFGGILNFEWEKFSGVF